MIISLKKIIREIDLNEIIIVFCLSVIVIILSLAHIVYGSSKTLPGNYYLFNGHYYLDYFYYLSFVGQGIFGKLMATQVFSTEDISTYPHLWPYILTGQLGKLFLLDVIKSYWASTIISIFLYIFLSFLMIEKILKTQNFTTKLAALLLATFSSPLFIPLSFKAGLHIKVFEYWYSYGNFFHRFETVPHHLLSNVLVLTVILVASKLISLKGNLNKLIIILYSFLIFVILFAAFSINPFSTAIVFGSIMLMMTVMTVYFGIIEKNYKKAANISFATALTGGLFILSAMIYRYFYVNDPTFLKNFEETEARFHQFIDFKTWILNIGIISFFIPFGLKPFIKKLTPIKLILIFTVILSTIFYFSRIDQIFGTHNGRFISPVNHLFYASVAILGIKEISKRVTKLPNFFFILIMLVLLSFIPPNIVFYKQMITDKNIISPISYLPKGIIQGYHFLNEHKDNKAVLTTPSQFLGQVLPAFVDKKVYIARYIATPNFLEKSYVVDWFYLGRMSTDEAHAFLLKNTIGYITLTSIEGYVTEPFLKYPFKEKIFKNYPFLKQIYINNDIVIFKVI